MHQGGERIGSRAAEEQLTPEGIGPGVERRRAVGAELRGSVGGIRRERDRLHRTGE